jgi:hypothetical protein
MNNQRVDGSRVIEEAGPDHDGGIRGEGVGLLGIEKAVCLRRTQDLDTLELDAHKV